MNTLAILALVSALDFSRPHLSIEVDRQNGDVTLTVRSAVPWRLETSGLLERGWFRVRDGYPDGGTVNVVKILDKRWAKVARQSFYRVQEIRLTHPRE